jgi:putative transposase
MMHASIPRESSMPVMRTVEGRAGRQRFKFDRPPPPAMARLPRLDIPLVPQHVIARGVNRQPCFFDHGDYSAYLTDVSDAAAAAGCAIHAYVLMTNHVHLLVTGHQQRSVSRMMQSVGRRYVRRINAARNRTGTLFQGRFRASLIESERYLLACMRYIELNPVRAGMVSDPSQYRWSSYRANAMARYDPLVLPHAEYVALGSDAASRADRYRSMLAENLPQTLLQSIREHANRDCALGNDAFQASIASQCGRRSHVQAGGRPSRPPSDLARRTTRNIT